MEAANTERNRRKTRVGLVESNKMDKTIVVRVDRLVKHRTYGKYVKRTQKFHVHDETNDSKAGDTVRIIETLVR